MEGIEHPPGYGEKGHNGPLRNDLPPKPEAWRPQIKGFVNTFVQDHIDWTVTKRDPLGPPDEEVRNIAAALAARTHREKEARQQY